MGHTHNPQRVRGPMRKKVLRDYRRGFITAGEASRWLGVHQSTIFRLSPPDLDWHAAREALLAKRYSPLVAVRPAQRDFDEEKHDDRS